MGALTVVREILKGVLRRRLKGFKMKNNPNQKPPAAFDEKAAIRQLRINWIKTGLGIGLLSVLAFGTLYAVGVKFSLILALLSLFGIALPLFSWYNSAKLVKRLMKCEKPDPSNPDHMRLVRLVDELYPLTGLKKKPEVLVSAIAMPNAFATGRNPENAFIAATAGLFSCDLTDDEIKAVLAHELAHVKSHDVAITSLTSVLASLFAILLSTGFPRFFQSAFVDNDKDLLDKLSNKVKSSKKGFVAPAVGVAGFFFSLVLFWIIGFFAKFVTLFVSRSRESAADVLAAQWTGNPCALSTALQKIVDWSKRHVMALRLKMILDGMGPLLFISVGEGKHAHDHDADPSGFSKWWQDIGANHPPMDQRLLMLNVLAGQTCPLLADVRQAKEDAFNAMIERKFGHLRNRNQKPKPGAEDGLDKGADTNLSPDLNQGTGENPNQETDQNPKQ
jgi:heat shock protein HtpX